MNARLLAASVAASPLLLATAAAAQETPAAAEGPTPVQELIITGAPEFRNRTEEVVPTLSYDLEYFQRFEPLTVGDALKRVPSVAFLSDVLEADGVRLRGLDPGYTQILINGERVPGAGVDRSFFVDRIPAELIERVEVVRSSSANRSGDAVAGAINIVLRDALTLDGGYVRGGLLYFDDGETKGTGGVVYGGALGPGRILLGASAQGRYNPKDKFSARFDEPGGELDNVEVQTDVRDGTDYSFNFAYEQPLAGGDFGVDGFFVRTDREEIENSIEYAEGDISDDALQTINFNPTDILTDNWALRGRWRGAMAGGETILRLGYARIDDEQFELEEETTFDDDDTPFPDADVFEGERVDLDIEDREWQARIAHERPLGGAKLEFGVDYTDKRRETSILSSETEVEIEDGESPDLRGDFSDFEPVAGGVNVIEERRIDPYVMLSGEAGALKWEAGLRYETTEVDVEDATVDDDLRSSSNDYGLLLPSASLRYSLTENDRIIASAARTVRRPNFSQLSPALLEGEFGDNDFVGDPGLDPETAWGFDIGYERRLGRRGVFGVNVFYRDVTDLIELFNTGDFSDEALGNFEDAFEEALEEGATEEEAQAIAEEELTSFVLAPRNTGDGKVYGVEFDLSTPLDFVGLPDTGVFLNYSWLDSEVNDEFGERRFNDQAEYVLNFGFVQDLPSLGAAFGATYRKQGDAFGRVVGEEVRTEYGADLEAFIEKRIGERVVVRLTGSNLLNASKDETFEVFNTIEDQQDRDYDEFELESEEAGPVFQLVVRATF
jgi:outer membrane receptor protein involved in Fe transport